MWLPHLQYKVHLFCLIITSFQGDYGLVEFVHNRHSLDMGSWLIHWHWFSSPTLHPWNYLQSLSAPERNVTPRHLWDIHRGRGRELGALQLHDWPPPPSSPETASVVCQKWFLKWAQVQHEPLLLDNSSRCTWAHFKNQYLKQKS